MGFWKRANDFDPSSPPGRRLGIGRSVLLGVAILSLALVLATPAFAGKCPNANRSPGKLTVAQARAAVICLINRDRHRAGVRKVQIDRKLRRAAQRHSSAMDRLGFFSHAGPNSSTPLSRIRATGYLRGANPWGIGENIAYGESKLGTPAQTVRGWRRSPPHRQTLLGRSYRDVGIGIVLGSPMGDSANGAIYTLDFGFALG